jgi:hypothetical protein
MFMFVGFLLIVLAGLIVWRFVIKFRKATGTTIKERFMAAFSDSGTIVIQRLMALSGSIIGGLVWLAELLNAPGVVAAIQAYLKPEYVAVAMVALAIITELVRRRKSSTDPI